ncbi:MAG TPA: metalloregulator ArsR/SmtB family transcription factor [Thermoanaerobaculia bacterium]|nr:metalloregulator ArsR/SmtB family transcription factor [Thermoanaerobaculia bacterium]
MLDAVPALAALADPLRLRAVRLLSREDLQVRELQRVVGAGQSRVSNHMSILRRAGLVETRRQDGHERYTATAEARSLWSRLASSVRDPAFAGDDERLGDVLEERAAAAPEGGFDAVAGEWDRIQGPFYASGAREAALLRLVPRGLTVADVGCGTGLLTLGLAAVAGHVHALDVSSRMVRLAREKVRRAGLSNVTVKRADVRTLPFAAGSLDAVFAFHLLRHLVRPGDALAEFGRVVRPGGRVVLVELEPHGHRALREATGSTHLGLPRETVRAGLRRAGFEKARFAALAPYRVPSESAETLLPTYLVDAVRAARGHKELS